MEEFEQRVVDYTDDESDSSGDEDRKKRRSPWPHQGSDLFTGGNSDDQEKEAASKSGVKIKQVRENIANNTEVCHVCNKDFNSRKALGGHMRMHALDAACTRKKIKLSGSDRDTARPSTCSICRKDFPSMKSLFGHMRSHSESDWRGIQLPSSPNVAGNNVSSTSTSTSTYQIVDSAAAMTMVVDLSRSLADSGWSVTAKRGRKGIKLSMANNKTDHYYTTANRSLAPGIEQRMQNAVYELTLLAHANPNPNPDPNQLQLHAEASNHCSFNKKISAVTEGVGGRKRVAFELDDSSSSKSESSDSHNSDTCTNSRSKVMEDILNNKEKRTEKIKSTDLETANDHIISNKLFVTATAARTLTPNNINHDSRYLCSICNKSFPSHQALGGHRSSHKKSKSIQIKDESESAAQHASVAEEEQHRTVAQDDAVITAHHCNICSKSFPTGQALGGHKRSHWTAIPNNMTLDFDLNQPATMSGDDVLSVTSH